MSTTTAPRSSGSFEWPEGEPYEDVQRGTLKSGKEAEIFLVERRFARSGPRLLAHKRYRPRYPVKGQLKEEGFSNSTSYRGDSVYKAGWFLPTRDKKAVLGGSRFGHELAAKLWPMQEWAMLSRAWQAGASVPYPVEQTELGLIMEFVGDDAQAAPKLVEARLGADELPSAWQQLQSSIVALTMAGLVHADLSPYNILWWQGRLVIIDLPQAVDAAGNNHAQRMLLRDVANLRDFFGRFAPELLATQFGAEIWALYTRGVLQPATPLTGRFEERQGPVDVAGVLRVVDDALDEEAARLLRMRTAG